MARAKREAVYVVIDKCLKECREWRKRIRTDDGLSDIDKAQLRESIRESRMWCRKYILFHRFTVNQF